MKNIVILDYGLGNVRSVSNAIRTLGSKATISNDKSITMKAEGLIIPGVGAFPTGMKNLEKNGLVTIIEQYNNTNRPILGICLGMQILFEHSTEFVSTKGLGLIQGEIKKLPIKPEEGRLPHIAWSKVAWSDASENCMFDGLEDRDRRFYFVHSFAAYNLRDQDRCGTTNYLGHEIVAAVRKDNIWGTQFHPEKSGPNGLHLLKNFINIC